MFCQPEDELKIRCKKAGISYRDLAQRFNKSYTTVGQWFNGFLTMPDYIRKELNSLLEQCESKKQRLVSEREQG